MSLIYMTGTVIYIRDIRAVQIQESILCVGASHMNKQDMWHTFEIFKNIYFLQTINEVDYPHFSYISI